MKVASSGVNTTVLVITECSRASSFGVRESPLAEKRDPGARQRQEAVCRSAIVYPYLHMNSAGWKEIG